MTNCLPFTFQTSLSDNPEIVEKDQPDSTVFYLIFLLFIFQHPFGTGPFSSDAIQTTLGSLFLKPSNTLSPENLERAQLYIY